MSDGNTWNISDLATEVYTVNQDYDEVKAFVESILETFPETTKSAMLNTGCPSTRLQQL